MTRTRVIRNPGPWAVSHARSCETPARPGLLRESITVRAAQSHCQGLWQAELATGQVAEKKKGLPPRPARRASLIPSPATWPVSEAMQAIPRRVLVFGRAAQSLRSPVNAGNESN